jgi:hypothetical protein
MNFSDYFPQAVRTDSPGVVAVAQERDRQVHGEFFTAHHDDALRPGVLADAAGCYVALAAAQLQLPATAGVDPPRYPPSDWPLAHAMWKPSRDPQRNLAKAGALIAAEYDRTQRQG